MTISIISPISNTKLDASSVMKGTGIPNTSVYLNGPGFEKNKKVSVLKDGTWSYELKNVFSKLPTGTITISATSEPLITQTFLNGNEITKPPVPVSSPPITVTNNIDLSKWKVTLPVDANNVKTEGKAIDLFPPVFTSPWFVKNSDGSLTFTAPADGATTSGSHYPRSELREMHLDGTLGNWTIDQNALLSCGLSVNELPIKSDGTVGRIVIGQIHGPNDELCRLYYDSTGICFYDDKSGDALKETQFYLKASDSTNCIPKMNEKFTYTISVHANILTVTATLNNKTYVASETIGKFWPNLAVYFKAGVYCQVGKPGSSAGTVGTGQGKATFYYISVSH